MKNLLLILLSFALLAVSCGEDEIDPNSTEPLKGVTLTVEEIVGTYVISSIRFPNTDSGIIRLKTEFTFKSDYTGIEFNPRTVEKNPFTWSLEDGVMEFPIKELGYTVKTWFEKTKNSQYIYFKNQYYDEEYIATFGLQKIKS